MSYKERLEFTRCIASIMNRCADFKSNNEKTLAFSLFIDYDYSIGSLDGVLEYTKGLIGDENLAGAIRVVENVFIAPLSNDKYLKVENSTNQMHLLMSSIINNKPLSSSVMSSIKKIGDKNGVDFTDAINIVVSSVSDDDLFTICSEFLTNTEQIVTPVLGVKFLKNRILRRK